MKSTKFRGRVGRTLAVLAVTGAVSIAVGVPASATTVSDCNYYYVCMFKDSSYNGGIASFTASVSNYSGHYFIEPISGLNDAASSIYNHNGSCNTNHYENSSYSGTYFSTIVGGRYSTIALNDQLSSHKNCPS